MEDFITTIRNAYLESRNAHVFFGLEASDNCPVIRGRSSSISSLSEDCIASLLISQLKDHNDVVAFVDQAVTVYCSNEKKQIYPDILLCKKPVNKDEPYKCFYMCDVKTDIGWRRSEIGNICNNHDDLIKNLDKARTYSSKRGMDKTPFNIIFSDCSYYDVVIISSGNGSKKVLHIITKTKNNKHCRCFLLTEGSHLNSYKQKKFDANPPKITKDFTDFLGSVKDSITKLENKQ